MEESFPDVLMPLVAAHHAGEKLILLFDYDGTLTPIVEHPWLAKLRRGPAICWFSSPPCPGYMSAFSAAGVSKKSRRWLAFPVCSTAAIAVSN